MDPGGFRTAQGCTKFQLTNQLTQHQVRLIAAPYPYGSAYDKAACNGPDANVGNAEAEGTLTTCQSSTVGYEGVYDLSGNVREWEDSCAGTAGKKDSCRLRGGSYSYFATIIACNDSYTSNRGYTDGDTGIRCCS